jgi:flagellum-specific peptidoglycan hydrolase FlgJ
MANDHVKMFAEEYGPLAERVSKQTGIAPSVLLAQWGMESKYGRSPVGQFNFGNIKDLSGAGNEGVDNKTKSKDKYLNFETPEDFGDYYAHMMRRLYPKTLNAGTDITKYTEGLRNGVKGSYFEDPNYEDAIRGAYKVTSNFYSDTSETKKEDNPNNPFAAGVPLADKAREGKTTEGTTTTETPTEIGASPYVGAVVGAGANAILPMFMEEPRITPRVDTGKAEEANLSARDKYELARRNLDAVVPQGTGDLDEAYRQNQAELERLKNEQKLAEARLKGMPKAPPAMEVPAPSSPFPQVSREGRASGPKVEGDSGTRNWMIQEAGQRHQLPEAVLDIATDKTKDSPTGGKRLINEDLANLEKIKQLGAGDYGLTTLPSGVQLQLPPTTVAERQADIERQAQANQAEIAQRAEQTRLQQEAQAQQFEQQRLANEAELARIQQERAQLGQQQNQLAKDLKYVAPLQKAVTTSQDAAELARRKLARAQQQPNAAGRVLEKAGVNATKIGPVGRTVTGGVAGYAGVMSFQEAVERFNAGDTSEGVLKALQAGSAAAATLPPAGKKMTKAKGLGALSAIGSYGYDFGRGLLRDAPPEK